MPAGLFVCQFVCPRTFVNSAGSAKPIRPAEVSKDAPEIGNDEVLVTWRHVSRLTRHVPPREKFEKNSNTATAQTGGGREPKLSGQKGLGLT